MSESYWKYTKSIPWVDFPNTLGKVKVNIPKLMAALGYESRSEAERVIKAQGAHIFLPIDGNPKFSPPIGQYGFDAFWAKISTNSAWLPTRIKIGLHLPYSLLKGPDGKSKKMYYDRTIRFRVTSEGKPGLCPKAHDLYNSEGKPWRGPYSSVGRASDSYPEGHQFNPGCGLQ